METKWFSRTSLIDVPSFRAWLNADFYASAFALGNDFVTATSVDNSAKTTETGTNPYGSKTTKDKVFLEAPPYKTCAKIHQNSLLGGFLLLFSYYSGENLVDSSSNPCRIILFERAPIRV